MRGHTDTIAGALYNCKDEHIASISRKGDLILHNLASGTKAAELKDPNGQVVYAVGCKASYNTFNFDYLSCALLSDMLYLYLIISRPDFGGARLFSNEQAPFGYCWG